MDVPSPIPFRVAQAYGATRVAPTADVSNQAPATPTGQAASVDQVELSSTTSTRLTGLVAGTVRSDINRGYGFDGDPVRSDVPRVPSSDRTEQETAADDSRAAGGSFPLYTRRAEHVEAATRLQVGSTIDIRG